MDGVESGLYIVACTYLALILEVEGVESGLYRSLYFTVLGHGFESSRFRNTIPSENKVMIIHSRLNQQDFLPVLKGSGIEKMEDNLTSADPLS